MPAGLDGQEVYIYSGQKLQFSELQKEEMRQRLSKDPNHHDTYSGEYLSQSFCLVNEGEIKLREEEEAKSRMLTKGSF